MLEGQDVTPEPAEASDGSITDGDDHLWLGNKEKLKGGSWREMTQRSVAKSILGKHSREEAMSEGDARDAAEQKHESIETSDLQSGAEDAEDEHSEIDSDEVQGILEWGHHTQEVLAELSKIVALQVNYKNIFWLRRFVGDNFVQHAERLLGDIRHVESTGRR
ncbi:hypothetical protein BKA93DRAFT_761622 [Sparassis latifolia]